MPGQGFCIGTIHTTRLPFPNAACLVWEWTTALYSVTSLMKVPPCFKNCPGGTANIDVTSAT